MGAYIAHPHLLLVVDKPVANIPACTFSRKRSSGDFKPGQILVCLHPLTQTHTQQFIVYSGLVIWGHDTNLRWQFFCRIGRKAPQPVTPAVLKHDYVCVSPGRCVQQEAVGYAMLSSIFDSRRNWLCQTGAIMQMFTLLCDIFDIQVPDHSAGLKPKEA